MGKEVELVIKISEEAYNRVLKSGVIYGSDTAYIGGAIIDSIELPENHGDLKDTEDIINKINLNYNNHQSIDAYSLKDMIITVPTIIKRVDDK